MASTVLPFFPQHLDSCASLLSEGMEGQILQKPLPLAPPGTYSVLHSADTKSGPIETLRPLCCHGASQPHEQDIVMQAQAAITGVRGQKEELLLWLSGTLPQSPHCRASQPS